MSEAIETRYLGDGVYASYDGYQVVLTTGHYEAERAQAVIYLNLDVLAGLFRYVEYIKKRANPPRENV